MRKKKILLHTNPTWLKTGLAENGRELAKYLHKTGKYEIYYYASQTNEADPVCQTTPWKTIGCLPSNPQEIQQLNSDPARARDAAYGGYRIEQVIKEIKPDIYLGSDDIWSFTFHNKEWFKKINSILHITVDSLPILEQAYDQSKHTKHYFTWAKFAQKEMKRFGGESFNHVKQIYGATDINKYKPISLKEKNELRKRFNISENTIIFGYLFRNQLRKGCPQIIKAFADFKKENPNVDAKLHFHTSFSEMGNGWNIPKLMNYFGVKQEDVLCTYVCKECGQWLVHPYMGEDINCPICKKEKSMITPNIGMGVHNDDMYLIHGLWDAVISPLTSGGLEYANVNALLCGLPLATTNYSSGEDFCEQDFVFSLDYETTFEAGTSFIKAATSINSIKQFIDRICKMSINDRIELGMRGRKWAEETFSIQTIGKQWENYFDSLPFVDWDNIELDKSVQKNESFQLPENYQQLSEDDFLTLLYKEILLMDEPLDGSGRGYWKQAIKNGQTREQIYAYFINVAKDDNRKQQKIEFGSLVDKDRPNKRALFLIKESLGDVLMTTQLFEDFHNQYPNTDLYIAVDPKFFEVLEGNPYIYKAIPYQPFLENEMIVIGAGQKKDDKLFDMFFHPAIMCQRQLQYLSIK